MQQKKFVETIIRIYDNISNKPNNYSKANQRVKLTKIQQHEFNQATHCYICKRESFAMISQKFVNTIISMENIEEPHVNHVIQMKEKLLK